MQRLEERAHFARLMETHLEMYILVLSQMHRSLGDRASLEIQASLTRKAQRMARLLLPDLILHSQSVSVSSASRQPFAVVSGLQMLFDKAIAPRSFVLSSIGAARVPPGISGHMSLAAPDGSAEWRFRLSLAG